MELTSKFDKGIRSLLCVICVINICCTYASVAPLKDKKGITILMLFKKKLDKSKRKPDKIWVDKGSKFYNRSIKSWLQDNYVEMYSTQNAGKCVVAERFISNYKIYKYMTPISKNMYIDKN